MVHDAVELRHHTTFGPSRSRQALMICIDDLHLPSDDAWGAWPVHEEVRQLAERHEFHAAVDNSSHQAGKQLQVEGCRIIAIARTTGISVSTIRRILDGQHEYNKRAIR